MAGAENDQTSRTGFLGTQRAVGERAPKVLSPGHYETKPRAEGPFPTPASLRCAGLALAARCVAPQHAETSQHLKSQKPHVPRRCAAKNHAPEG